MLGWRPQDHHCREWRLEFQVPALHGRGCLGTRLHGVKPHLPPEESTSYLPGVGLSTTSFAALLIGMKELKHELALNWEGKMRLLKLFTRQS